MPASSYSGPARILDPSGVLLSVGTATLETADDPGTWSGELEVMAGSGVAGKALVVVFEIDGRRGLAQLLPTNNQGVAAHSRVVGLGPWTFS